MREMTLSDDGLVILLYRALLKMKEVTQKGYHFASISPSSIFLHIKTNGIQKCEVKFHIHNGCSKPDEYLPAQYSSLFLNTRIMASKSTDLSGFILQSLYALCLSLLHIVTNDKSDIQRYDPSTIFDMVVKKYNKGNVS